MPSRPTLPHKEGKWDPWKTAPILGVSRQMLRKSRTELRKHWVNDVVRVNLEFKLNMLTVTGWLIHSPIDGHTQTSEAREPFPWRNSFHVGLKTWSRSYCSPSSKDGKPNVVGAHTVHEMKQEEDIFLSLWGKSCNLFLHHMNYSWNVLLCPSRA